MSEHCACANEQGKRTDRHINRPALFPSSSQSCMDLGVFRKGKADRPGAMLSAFAILHTQSIWIAHVGGASLPQKFRLSVHRECVRILHRFVFRPAIQTTRHIHHCLSLRVGTIYSTIKQSQPQENHSTSFKSFIIGSKIFSLIKFLSYGQLLIDGSVNLWKTR
jgi:hypothetical protein